ncbi:MAG: hypothetical protein J5758_07145, partial [Abditibacteriota bacterium]|nr:hypothetical protein [Abditibacteriota bacterium]
MSIPKRPRIRKHGTVKLHTVETTPIAFGNRLYRFEYVRPGDLNPNNSESRSYFHFIDLMTGQATRPFAFGHHLGSAYSDGGFMYATGVDQCWGGDTLHIFRSEDLQQWELWGELALPGHEIYNTGICKKEGAYTLLYEIGAPADEAGIPFTFRFAASQDLSRWTLMPRDCVFQKDRYAGGPAIYYINDGYYYVLYLEEYAGPCYANCIARSGDLVRWEYSRINPVLMFDEYADKQIANPFLNADEQRMIDKALDINNSDMEICEW